MSDNQQFLYKPIQANKHQTRVLVIDPGEEDDGVVCSLQHIDLDFPPAYSALSYTWGNSRAGRPIKVDGQTFFVRINLDKALRRFRSLYEKIWIWVDAICINQNDIEERNNQVTYMHLVYEQAKEVFVWLGDAGDNSSFLIDKLNKTPIDSTLEDADALLEYYSGLLSSPIFLRALMKLLGRPWWMRVWTMQELICAKSFSFYCGPDRVSEQLLRLLGGLASDYVLTKAMSPSAFHNLARYAHIGFLTEFRTLRKQAATIDLERLLKLVRIRASTDPRDKVYATFNIVASHDWPFRPDYHKSPAQVFSEVAQYIVARTERLDILSSCEVAIDATRQDHLRSNFQIRAVEGLPSWVPNWTRPRTSGSLSDDFDSPKAAAVTSAPRYKADNGLRAQCIFHKRFLHIRGFVHDEIAEANPFVFDANPLTLQKLTWPHFFRELQVWVNSKFLAPYCTNACRTNILLRTLTGNTVDTHSPRSIAEEVEIFKTWLSSPHDSQITSLRLKHILRTSLSRRLFVTKKGYLGLGHALSRPGDKICIFLGAAVPMVIRSENLFYVREHERCRLHSILSDCEYHGCFRGQELMSADGNNLLVGDCYVHGIMQGEAVREFQERKAVFENIVLV